MQLKIRETDLPAFLACLGIGVLSAIRTGTLPPEMGIWTLAAPKFWKPLLDISAVPRGILDVLQTCDELSAMRRLMAEDEFDAQVAGLIDQLQIELAKIEDPVWEVRWDLSSDE